jgi:hypothetical protein
LENTGTIGGASLYWTGIKEGIGEELPDEAYIGAFVVNMNKVFDSDTFPCFLEEFMEFLDIEEKYGSENFWGSRITIRGRDTKAGPGFRAAVQIQPGSNGFPYAMVVTAIGEAVDFRYRGENGASSYLIEPSAHARLLAHGFDENSIELANSNTGASAFKLIVYDASDNRQLRGTTRSLQNSTACLVTAPSMHKKLGSDGGSSPMYSGARAV